MTPKATAGYARARILFVVPRFHTNLAQAVRVLVESGFAVGIFASTCGDGEDHRYTVPKVFGSGESRERIRAALREFAPDLILLRKTPPLSQHVARISAFGRYKTLSYDLRPLDKPRPRSRLLAHWLTGRPVHRVTPVPGRGSGGSSDLFATLLPWPVDRTDDAMPPRTQEGPLRVVCVAKLKQPRKNQLMLVKAMRRALEQGQATLALVGSSVSLSKVGAQAAPYFAELLAASRDTPGIEITGDVPYVEMPRIYRSHDVCVLPSREEPLGMAPLEAMAYGCVPLISTDCGSAGYIRDGENGRLFDPDDAGELARQLDALALDRELLGRMSGAALETARTQLGPEEFVAGVERLLTRMKTRRR